MWIVTKKVIVFISLQFYEEFYSIYKEILNG
jgi:hypothetical protein